MVTNREASLTTLVCNVGGDKEVALGDIPAREWGPLCKATGDSWWALANGPLETLERGLAVFAFCCKRAGVEPWEPTTNELWAAFYVPEREEPPVELGEDGLPVAPDPTPADPTTLSSSTSPPGSVGTPTRSDD